MKKKLLLVLSLIAVFTCLFAVSVFAAEIGGIYYDLSGSGDTAVAKVNTQNKTLCELETVDIPEYVEQTVNGVTTRYKVVEIYGSAFGSTSASTQNNQYIKHLIIPSTVSKIGTHAFRNLANLETVVIKSKSETGVEFSNAEFYSCYKLTSVDMSESDVTVIGQYCFTYCSALTTVKVSPRLKKTSGESFRGCSAITELDLSYTQLEDIKGLWDIKVTKLVLPSTLTTIRGNGIQSTNMSTMVLPHGITTLEQNCLANNYSLYLLYFPEVSADASIHSNLFNGANPEVVIYPGNNTDASYTKLTGDGGPFKGYTIKHISEYDPTKTYSGKNFFYGATTCQYCNGPIGKETEMFNGEAYISSYVNAAPCLHCEKNSVASTICGPLFVNLGYSVAEFDGTAFTYGISLNKENIAIYQEKTGVTLNYGFIIGLAGTEAVSGEIVSASGESLLTTSIITNFAETIYSKLNVYQIKMAEINSDAQKALPIYCNAYITNGENVSYIGEVDKNGKAVAITLDGLLKK